MFVIFGDMQIYTKGHQCCGNRQRYAERVT